MCPESVMCSEVGLLGDELVTALYSTVDLFIDESVLECAVKRRDLVGAGGLLRV